MMILFILCFILNTLSLLLARDAPVAGYEFSIYTSTPAILWFSIICSLLLGISTIIYDIYKPFKLKSNLTKISLFLIFLCYTTCLSLYIIRGYYAWCMIGDPASHLMISKIIVLSGYILPDVVYPISHVYLSETFLLTNINILDLTKYIPLIFGITYILFMYLYTKLFLGTTNQVVVATLASMSFIHGSYLSFTPNYLLNLLFPLLIYVFIRYLYKKKLQWAVLNIIFILICPLFHPLPLLIFSIFIISYSLTPRFGVLFTKYKNMTDNLPSLKFNLLLILLIWTIIWISNYREWNYTINSIQDTIVGSGNSYLSELLIEANTANQYGYSVTEQVIKTMGSKIVLFVSALISFPIIIRSMSNNSNQPSIFYLYGPLFIICFSIPAFYLTKMAFGPLRIVTYIAIICTVFFGFLWGNLIENKHLLKRNFYRYCMTLFLLLLLMGMNINGILTLYPSPYVTTQNYETTKHSIEGINWILHTRNLEIATTGMTISQYRLSLVALSPDELNKIGLIDESKVTMAAPDNIKVPYHFGYDTNSSLANYYNKNIYLLITVIDRQIYTKLLSKMESDRWNQSDYKQLDTDSGVWKLYSNGEFDTYFIKHYS